MKSRKYSILASDTKLHRQQQFKVARRRTYRTLVTGFIGLLIIMGVSSAQSPTAITQHALPTDQTRATSSLPGQTTSTQSTAASKYVPYGTSTSPQLLGTTSSASDYTPYDCDFESVPYTKTTRLDALLPAGQTQVTTYGLNGSEKTCYPYGRSLNSVTTVITQPVTQVTSIGTYVAPTYTAPSYNGYYNVDDNYVPSPNYSGDTEGGYSPTYTCSDGSYSYAQHSQGACSHHGGIE